MCKEIPWLLMIRAIPLVRRSYRTLIQPVLLLGAREWADMLGPRPTDWPKKDLEEMCKGEPSTLFNKEEAFNKALADGH